MSRFFAIAWKELIQVRRDRLSMGIMVGIPVIQLLLFGYAINTDVRDIYSYGGSIQITGNKTVSNIYDYMQANLSDVFSTETGTIYDSYVNLILGNSSDTAMIEESTDMTINIKEGFGFSAGSANGTTVNLLSDTWNFKWFADNGTFFRKYTFDVTVMNSTGDPLNNAEVTLYDNDGGIVFQLNTNSSGQIDQQVITYALYNYTGNSTFSPFTIKVVKYPFVNYTAPLALDRATYLPVTMSVECDPALYYSYIVESGDDMNVNRSSAQESMTMVAQITTGFFESGDMESGSQEIKAPSVTWTSGDLEPGEQEA